MLSAPVEVAQGAPLVATVAPATVKACRIQSTSPDGVQRSVRIDRRAKRAFSIRATVGKSAKAGAWDLRLRCGASASAPVVVRVVGSAAAKGRVLFKRVQARSFSTKYPTGFGPPRPNQDGPGPATEATDGLGASEGDRGRGAIEWATAQQGRTDYDFWCLKFVAHAFGAPAAGFATAQLAADALGTRGRGESPRNAPAGALMFFHYQGKDGVNYGHVGISLGDGRMISALKTVRIDDAAADPYWSSNYLGWAYAPAAWPGRAVTAAPQAPPPPLKLIVDNRTTNGASMAEDDLPATLTTKPWINCTKRGCDLPATARKTGETYESPVCQTTGDEATNGNRQDPADDANPDLATSNRYYGVRLADGTFGFLNEIWVRKDQRGGLKLPTC